MSLLNNLRQSFQRQSPVYQLSYAVVMLLIVSGVIMVTSMIVKLYLIIALCLLPVFLLIQCSIRSMDELITEFDQTLEKMRKQ